MGNLEFVRKGLMKRSRDENVILASCDFPTGNVSEGEVVYVGLKILPFIGVEIGNIMEVTGFSSVIMSTTVPKSDDDEITIEVTPRKPFCVHVHVLGLMGFIGSAGCRRAEIQSAVCIR